MKKIVLILSVLVSFSSLIKAQEKSIKDAKKFNEALELLANKKYQAADNLLTELSDADKENLDYIFYKGICELNTGKEDEAIEHFDKIIKDYDETKEPKKITKGAYFYKAEALHNLYRFDEEIDILKQLNNFDLKDKEKEQLKKAITSAENAKEIFFDFKPIIVTRLDILNSGYDDHTPIPTSDGKKLYFTSKRPGGVSGDALSEEGKYYEDIWFWDGEHEPVNVGPPVNTFWHDATGGLSLDGKTLFIYRTKEKEAGDLYAAVLNSDNKWGDPVKLGKNINKKRAVERHAALSPNGKKLYFSSDAAGGKGGRDIWVSELQSDSTWGKPVNLNINTEYDEEAPYMLSDGITFYFSSKGYKGMGGYDIFKCMLQNDGTFSEPQNVGFPVNTVEDDVFFFPVSSEDVAYFTRRKTDNAEIYKTIFPDNTLIVESNVKAKESDDDDLYPLPADITVFDVNSEEEPDAYTLNVEKAKYKTVIIPDKNYKFLYDKEGYVFDTEDIPVRDMTGKKVLEKEPVLVKIEQGKTEKFKNMSFNDKSVKLTDYTKKELDIIAGKLAENDSLVVDLSAGKNPDLDNERKQKAVDYLKNKGIDANRIYTDLSPRDIPANKMEYTIYDTESVKKAIENKNNNQTTIAEKFYIVKIENLLFKFDKSVFNIENDEELDKLCKYLKDNPQAAVELIGFTDAVGSSVYNDKLSERRALAVKKYMLAKGVAGKQIKTAGFGEDNPVAYNKKDGKYYEPSKKYNRRVEFRVISQGNPKLNIIQFKTLPDEYKHPDYKPDYKR